MNDSLKKCGVSNDGTYYSVTISDDWKEYLVNNSIPDYSEIVTTDCLKGIVERDETIENLYKKIFSQKILNSYTTQNNSVKQRSNNQEEMSCLKLIADRNNTNKNFHK